MLLRLTSTMHSGSLVQHTISLFVLNLDQKPLAPASAEGDQEAFVVKIVPEDRQAWSGAQHRQAQHARHRDNKVCVTSMIHLCLSRKKSRQDKCCYQAVASQYQSILVFATTVSYQAQFVFKVSHVGHHMGLPEAIRFHAEHVMHAFLLHSLA